jgi:hypothetical protein
MRAIVPWLLVLALLPQVEDPWPDTIDLELPFRMAGAGCVLAGALCFLVPQEKREHAIKLGGFLGFSLGSAFYLISLASQVISGL